MHAKRIKLIKFGTVAIAAQPVRGVVVSSDTLTAYDLSVSVTP